MLSTLGSPAVFYREGVGTLNVYAILGMRLERFPTGFEAQVNADYMALTIANDAIPLKVLPGDQVLLDNVIYTIDHTENSDGFMSEFSVVKTGMGSIPVAPWDPKGTLQKLDGLDYFSFDWGDASPKLLFTVIGNRIISEVVLHITEAFDAAGTKLTVGDAVTASRLMNELENQPGTAGSYMTHPSYIYSKNTPVYLTIFPGEGNSKGKGVVEIKYED